jgi:hypothetical protein
MKKTAAALAMALGLMVPGINADVLYLYGKIDSVNTPNSLIKAGDAVYIKINYSPSTNAAARIYVTVNESSLNLLRGAPGGTVFVDANPNDGTVQWNVSNSSSVAVDVATDTPGGVIPCIDDFNLGRSLEIFYGNVIAYGTITAIPRTRPGN